MSRLDGILMLLNAAQTVAAPVLLLKKWRRFRARGDAYEWDLARWKAPKIDSASTEAVHLILVAMGFAETRLAARLTKLLLEKRPDLRITWAIRNAPAAIEGGAIPENQAVVPMPFDYFWSAKGWIEAVDPDTVIFIERFAFPNFARGLFHHGARVGAVAARTRDAKKQDFYTRWLLEAFELIALRSEAERAKFGALAENSERFRVTGSLKFWPELPSLPPLQERELKTWLQSDNRPILAAGSTQPGDETWVFEAFAPLCAQYGARLLLAPRHVARAGEVEALARERGFSVARRSEKIPIPGADVLLLDTLGELAHAYGAACAAFVGGTLTGTGHNVLEPIAHGIPVFFGPKSGTFAAEQEMCLDAGVGFRVVRPEDLTRGWERVLENAAWRAQVEKHARELNAQGALAWGATTDAIAEILPESRANRSQ